MRCLAFAALLMALPAIPLADEAPKVTIGVVTFDPESPAKLHYLGQVYVGIHYKSTVPVKIFASLANSSDFHQYVPVISMIIPGAASYPAGEGDALCAVSPSLGRAADADTMEIIVKSAETDEALKVIRVPVAFGWDTQHLPKPEPAAWVKALEQKLNPAKRP